MLYVRDPRPERRTPHPAPSNSYSKPATIQHPATVPLLEDEEKEKEKKKSAIFQNLSKPES